MIVQNEEKYLGKCLDSVKDFVDEIIIVDTGSIDTTIEIAKRFTDKIYRYEWQNDFSKARNISLSYAAGEWILVLDADEIIAEEDFKKIKNLINNDSAEGYILNQRNYTNDFSSLGWTYCLKESKHTLDFKGYMISRLVRLFKNHKGFKFKNKVHELVTYSIKEKEGKIISTDIVIHHYKESKPEETKKDKRIMYLKLGEEQIKQNSLDERAYYETGLIYMKLGEQEKAIEKFKKVIELNSNYKNIYYNLGNAYYRLKKFEEAKEALKNSIKKNSRINSAYNLLGMIYQEQGEYRDAIDILIKGIKINENDLLLQSLGGIYVKLGMFGEAVKSLERALAINPENIGALNNLGGAYSGLKKYDEAIRTLKQIISRNDNNFKIRLNLALVYLEKGERNNATKVLDELTKLFPEQEKVIKKILGN